MDSDYCINLSLRRYNGADSFVKPETPICGETGELCIGAYKEKNVDVMPFKLKENPYCARREKLFQPKNWGR